MKIRLLTFGLITTVLFTMCKPDIDAPQPRAGELSADRFVVMGDGYAAGYSENGLSQDRQQNSFPAIIAKSISEVSENSIFPQPIIEDWASTGNITITTLTDRECSPFIKEPSLDFSSNEPSNLGNVNNLGPYHDWTIPGLRVADVNDRNRLAKNSYFKRMVEPSVADEILYTEKASGLNGDFVILSFGFEELMEYAMCGGENLDGRPLKLTENSVFRENLKLLFQIAFADEATQGFVHTIPNYKQMPYFNTYNPKEAVSHDCGLQTNVVYTEVDGGTPKPLKQGDMVLLSALGTLGYPNTEGHLNGIDARAPLSTHYILDEEEIIYLDSKVQAYNAAIMELANEFNVPVFDLNALYNQVDDGLLTNGATINNEYMTGGFYSLDGIYPSARGNAVIANAMIEFINNYYEASVPLVNVFDYSSVDIPQ